MQTSQKPDNTGSSILIPIAIIIGFGLIAAAIYFNGLNNSTAPAANTDSDTNAPTQTGLEALNPITEDDHIRGNPNAPIVLVEYSDYDCPYCKNFHETMQLIMAEYGQEGDVAWVYRHFPLEQLHPSAPYIAQASECVADLGGNDAFWIFSDLVFDEREINEQTNITRLSSFAEAAGISKSQFDLCLNNDKFQDKVNEDFDNAVAIGGRGTPHTIIMVGDELGVINGAQPYDVVKEIIDGLLTQIEQGTL